jgi:hypothetical protein
MVLGRSFTVLVLETTQKLRNEKGVDLKGEENGGSTTVIILLSQNTSNESFMMQ